MSMSDLSDPTLITIGADCYAGAGDVSYLNDGAPELVAGLAQYYQRIGRLLAARDILGSPGVGAGLAALRGQTLTPQAEQAALAAAQAVMLADPLTADVAALAVSVGAPPFNPDDVVVTAQIQLVNQPGPLTMSWTV